MNRCNLYKIGVFLWCAGILTSCKKLVELPNPIDTTTNAVIFNADAQADQAVAGLYSQLIPITNSTFSFAIGNAAIYGGLAADELLLTQESLYSGFYNVQKNAIAYDDGLATSDIWASAYSTIHTANAILLGEEESISPTLTQRKRNEIKAHAKFMRALAHFNLAGFYGKIPLVLSAKYKDNGQLYKSSLTEVYGSIINDLKDAIDHFTLADYPINKGKANKFSAEALLARTYLYVEDWEKAYSHANNVINNGGYSLSTLDKTFDINNTEAIFQLNHSSNWGKPAEVTYLIPLLPMHELPAIEQEMLLDPMLYPEFEAFLKPIMELSPSLLDAFEPQDERASSWIKYSGTPSVAPYNGKKVYYAYKYSLEIGNKKTYTILRLAELYLIRAEAAAHLDKLSEAITDIDVVRTRAGLQGITATGKAAILAAVFKERRTELFAEWGHRLFDLKRTGEALNVLGQIPYKAGLTAEKLDFPIDVNEILNNPRLGRD